MKRLLPALLSLALLLPAAAVPARAADSPQVRWFPDLIPLSGLSCGYALVSQDGDEFFMDPQGARLSLDGDYTGLEPFCRGLAKVSDDPDGPLNGMFSFGYSSMGWVGLDGRLSIPLDYVYYTNACFTNYPGGDTVPHQRMDDLNWVLLDTQGGTSAPLSDYFPYVFQSFYDGLVPAMRVSDAQMGFLDTAGALVIPAEYDGVEPFTDGMAQVLRDGETAFIDVTGAVVVPFAPSGGFDGSWCYDGLLWLERDGKYGCVDSTGAEVIPFQYEDCDRWSGFSQGLCSVTLDGEQMFLDTDGNPRFSVSGYSSVDSFREGLCPVEQDGKYGYIDATGALVFPCIYQEVQPVTEGWAWVRNDAGAWGLLESPYAAASPWAVDELAQARVACLLTERTADHFTGVLTRLQCAELCVNLAEQTLGKSFPLAPADRFTDTKDWMARKAATMGIAGDSSVFDPGAPMTRAQAADMLLSTVQSLEAQTGRSLLPAEGDALSQLTALGVVRGGPGPDDPITLEQALLLALRIRALF